MGEITFSYPTWFILFCILAALVVAALLYFRDKTFRQAPSWLSTALGVLRFATVFGIALLLLGPLMKSVFTETQKPIVVLAQDQSESVAASMNPEDSSAYVKAWRNLESSLSENYKVETYSFGSETSSDVDFQFDEKSTNLSKVFQTLYDDFDNRNLGAVLLATDGIFNEGSNPVYLPQKITAPIYTLGLGDTTTRKDLLIKRTFNNEIAYLGDKFTVQVDLSAKNCLGSTTEVSIRKKGGQVLSRKQVKIDRNDFFATEEFTLDADKAGVQNYLVSLSRVKGEVSTTNNTKSVFVEVLDARQQILLLAAYPHPDLGALKEALQTNKNYEITTATAGKWNGQPEAYDMVVFHMLPTASKSAEAIIKKVQNRKIPHLFVVGSETNLPKFNSVQTLLSIQGDGKNTNEVQGIVASNFNYFNLSDALKGQMVNFPPLIAPFGKYNISGNVQVLANQRIGKVDTDYPLLLLGEVDGYKQGVLTGEGIWKWRIFDYLQNQNQNQFDELFTKVVQYLTVKQDKRQFRVSQPKKVFKENETVVFDAQLYNESYEQINTPDASLKVTDSDGKQFDFVFDKTSNAYRLDAGVLAVGDYQYQARASYNGQNLKAAGQFSVQPVQLESYALEADHDLLKAISEKYGARLLTMDQLDQFSTMLQDRGSVKPVIFESTKTQSVINLRWLFALLAILLAVEWFLRRYYGGY